MSLSSAPLFGHALLFPNSPSFTSFLSVCDPIFRVRSTLETLERLFFACSVFLVYFKIDSQLLFAIFVLLTSPSSFSSSHLVIVVIDFHRAFLNSNEFLENRLPFLPILARLRALLQLLKTCLLILPVVSRLRISCSSPYTCFLFPSSTLCHRLLTHALSSTFNVVLKLQQQDEVAGSPWNCRSSLTLVPSLMRIGYTHTVHVVTGMLRGVVLQFDGVLS